MRRRVPFLVALSLSLVAVDHAGMAGPAVDGARHRVRAALDQLQAGAARPLAAVAGALGRADDLNRENARLRRSLTEARARAAWADSLARDNTRLAALAGLSAPAAAPPRVPARVVALPTGRAGSTVLVDQGQEAGVEEGMPVVAGGALVGRVVGVAAGRASVLPVVDPAAAVGVRLIDSGDAGVAEGRGRNLSLSLLDPEAEAAGGVLVVTAGVRHGLYPPGLPVGHVAGGGRTVVPVVALARLETVEILLWRPPA